MPVVRLLVEFFHSGPEEHVCTLDPDGGTAHLPPCTPGDVWLDRYRGPTGPAGSPKALPVPSGT
jgi:hypothetical protein